jgi:hypothetical protein
MPLLHGHNCKYCHITCQGKAFRKINQNSSAVVAGAIGGPRKRIGSVLAIAAYDGS